MKHFLVFYIGITITGHTSHGNCVLTVEVFPNRKKAEELITTTNCFRGCVLTNIIALTEEDYTAWMEGY